jgi:hypothetical protein
VKGCDHKFVDSRECLKCGVGIDELRRASAAELEALGGRADPLDLVDDALARALAADAAAARHPQLDDTWLPVVEYASQLPEVSGATYGANWLRLHFRLGAVSTSIMLALEHVTQARAPVWQKRIRHALEELRLGRARFELKPTAEQELDERVRRGREALRALKQGDAAGVEGQADE